MGAGKGGALVPPWNFKIIIIIVYKCNTYLLLKVNFIIIDKFIITMKIARNKI